MVSSSPDTHLTLAATPVQAAGLASAGAFSGLGFHARRCCWCAREGRGRTLIDRAGAYCGGMDNERAFPVIRQAVLDTTDPRRLAEVCLPAAVRPAVLPGRRAARTRPARPERTRLADPVEPGQRPGPGVSEGRRAARGDVAGRPGPAAVALGRHGARHRLAWTSSMSWRSRSAPGCSRTARMTRRSRCGSTPILRGTRFASLRRSPVGDLGW